MHQPVVYAIVAMTCYGLGDFIYKQTATAGIRSDHFLMAQAWFLSMGSVCCATTTRLERVTTATSERPKSVIIL